ncbi:keratin, type I cytoskeletal 9 isoform X4 [Zeugodacus cucurbitae]|uniref:keratin, type I cytoskeletal 9 isoform X4 n=1 Tax=Zeugodacus cucurbitae TaxID=28588 RepID=UPI0010A74D95|nr:keratin, type I cytoskeletal 9 isoform X4 [Zeugodacus cucurbitae]
MAFSTQKEFFHVPFMNETVDYECRKACVKLKTYQSTIDHRSWAMDESLQSRFLSDLINCQSPVGGFGDGDVEDDYDNAYDRDGTGVAGRVQGRGLDAGRGGRPKQGTESGYVGQPGMSGDEGAGPSGRGRMGGTGGGGPGKGGSGGGGPSGGPGSLISADSVLACANEQMGRMQELLLHKKNLEKQLEVSNERLKVSNMENDKIKAIMNKKFDGNNSKDFYNKIQKLTSSGKISKGEENELLQIYNKFEDMSKAYEILQAENAYLKRLMEKLSLRASFETLKVEPEKSADIGFLQNEVNKLRKEVSILRKFEDDKLRGTMDNRNKMSDQDAETLKAIIKERNSLREKCKTFKDLEAKVYELQKIAKEADKMSDSLSSDLDSQSKHINKMEHEMKQMQDYYEDQIAKHKFNEDILRCQLDEMKEDLIRARCSAQKAECLQMEIGSLRNELMRRELALNDYNCQYNQLMYKAKKFRNSGYCMCNRDPDAGHDNENCLSDN